MQSVYISLLKISTVRDVPRQRFCWKTFKAVVNSAAQY